ncbi:MAG: nitrous oxide reductase family maturation protein NosD, partial [Candidatus Thermofonsia Clade 3 bacterium]
MTKRLTSSVSNIKIVLATLLASGLILLALQMHAFASDRETTQCGHATLQAMIDAAQPGDALLVPAGVYAGPIQIDKPLTLEGQLWPVIQGDGQGHVVVITAPNVTLRGFVVRGSGASLDREDSAIRVSAPNSVIENNRIEDALFGVYLERAADSVVRSNTIYGMDLPISRRG